MSEPTESNRTAASIARQLADECPESSFPCPACGAEVKATNLSKHLEKVHELAADQGDDGASWLAVDRRINPLTLIPIAATVPAFFGFDYGVEGLDEVRIRMAVFIVVFTLACVPGMLAMAGKFKARVEVDDRVLRIRYALGLLSKEVSFPVTLETGSLHALKEGVMVKDGHGYRGPSEDVKVGAYVRVSGSNGRSVVLGSKRSARLAKYWDRENLGDGGVRRWWDVDMDPVHMVQLQYQLAARGLLRPR